LHLAKRVGKDANEGMSVSTSRAKGRPRSARALRAALIGWYDSHRRHLPWRAAPGETADPYRVWLSEIMLQQTTVATVAPYFARFLSHWPSLAALAEAPLERVLEEWAGLGYYARARHLHACAKAVLADHGGRFPAEEDALRRLPGIGPYTAAAIAAIAFGRRASVVDGNVERVVTRLFALRRPLGQEKAEIAARAAWLSLDEPAEGEDRPGDFAQAMMDLGAGVCTPRAPDCPHCPWEGDCAARRLGLEESLPRRVAKPSRPLRRGIVFWIERRDGAVLVRRRPPRGLLGGMVEFPSSAWREGPPNLADAAAEAPVEASWRLLPGSVRHVFSHFALELEVAMGKARGRAPPDTFWAPRETMAGLALPSVMRKIIRHVR
jgi:A/G-specific adenine glycosylase